MHSSFYKIDESLSMQLINMPLFEFFLPIIQNNSIQNWTSSDFWEHMKLSKKERTRFNRQRLYRILKKLVEFGFLNKEINQSNPKFSRFKETEKLNEFKILDKSKLDLSNMKSEEKKLILRFFFLKNKLKSIKN